MQRRKLEDFHPSEQTVFDRAAPLRLHPTFLAAVICGALSCLAIGALIGVYLGANSIALF